MSLGGWRAPLIAIVLAIGCDRGEQGDRSQAVPAARQEAAPADAPPTGETKPGARQRRVFVSNYRADTVSVLEGEPEMEVQTIPGGGSPHGLEIRPTEPRLLAIAESTGFGVIFVDPNTLERKGEVETSRGPQDLVYSADGKRLFVISPLQWDLQVIDVDAMKVVGKPLVLKKKPRRILLSPDGKKLFVLLVAPGDGVGAEIAVIDVESLEIEKSIPVGRHPQAMAIGNNDTLLVSASFDDSTLSVIDLATLELKVTQNAETGMGLAVHKTKPIAYSMVSFDDEIHVVDLESGKTVKTLSAGRWPTYPSFGPGGRYLYIPHEESDSVVKLDTETNEVVAKIAVGEEPIEVVVYEPQKQE